MTQITLYEDNAGRLYWHRDGDDYVVFGEPTPEMNGAAAADLARYDDWAGSADDARLNGWDVIDEVPDGAKRIAAYSLVAFSVFHPLGIAGQLYIDGVRED